MSNQYLPGNNNHINFKKINECDFTTPYTNIDGSNTRAFVIPNSDFKVQAGKGIKFLVDDKVAEIQNTGLTTLSIVGQSTSGLLVTNTGTNTDPIYVLSLNYNDLKNQGLVGKVIYNGREYSPIGGTITIDTSYSQGIQNLVSPNKTIYLTTQSVGTYGIDVRPMKANGVKITPATDGTPIDVINGSNTIVEVIDSTLKVNVPNNSFIKTITINGTQYTPNTSGNISLGITNTEYLLSLTLDSTQATALTTTGLDLNSVTPSSQYPAGDKTLSSEAVSIYYNGLLISPLKITRTGAIIKFTGVSVTNGGELVWRFTK